MTPRCQWKRGIKCEKAVQASHVDHGLDGVHVLFRTRPTINALTTYQIIKSRNRNSALNSEQFSPGGQGPQAMKNSKGNPAGKVSEIFERTYTCQIALDTKNRMNVRTIFQKFGFRKLTILSRYPWNPARNLLEIFFVRCAEFLFQRWLFVQEDKKVNAGKCDRCVRQ